MTKKHEQRIEVLEKKVEQIKKDVADIIKTYKVVNDLNKDLFRAEVQRISQHTMDARHLMGEYSKQIAKTLKEIDDLKNLRHERALEVAVIQLQKDHATLTSVNETLKMILEYIKNLDKKLRVLEK